MNPSRQRITMVNMGCRVNQFEGEIMQRQCLDKGFVQAEAGQRADVVVVNTCTVTGESDRQARQLIRRAAREHPGARIVVTGCYAQRDPAALAALPGVSMVLGNHEKLRLERFLDDPFPVGEPLVRVGDPGRPWEAGGPPLLSSFSERVRAHIQVQTGCNERCAFCIIPGMRGASRSVPKDDVLEQARRFIAAGYPELVLSGINLGSYGREFSPPIPLSQLVAQLLAWPGLGRLRLSSIDPADLDAALIDAFAHPRMAPHLHLSIQSGDDRILKRMHRHGNRSMILETINRLRRVQPDLMLGADLIVGFPTETREAFEQTLSLVEEAGLSLLHVFRYSPRPGTPAAAIPRRFHVNGEEIRHRAEQLRQAGETRLLGEMERRVGCTPSVVVETISAGWARGKCGGFLDVMFPGSSEVTTGWMGEVLVTGVDGEKQVLLARGKK